MISLRKILSEAFSDHYRKNTWVKLPRHIVTDNADVLFDLVQTSYASKGGNLKIKSRNDITNQTEINYWLAIDSDTDPEPDAAIAGRSTPKGHKISILSTDGGKDAKRFAVHKMIELMRKNGFYAELDVELADKFGLNVITDTELISKVLSGKEIKFLDNGVYTRSIGSAGKFKEKVLVGMPK